MSEVEAAYREGLTALQNFAPRDCLAILMPYRDGGNLRDRAGPMKTTTYFREQVLRKRTYLQIAWVEQVIANPERRSVQEDGRIRFWGWVPELGRWLRVVTLEDGETVHNAFPNRDFDPGRRP